MDTHDEAVVNAEEKAESKLTRRELLTRATQAGLGMAAAASLGPLAACAPAAPQQPAAAGAGAPAPAAKPAAPAVVKGQTMVAGVWGGAFAQAIREVLIPDFEKDHSVKVNLQEGLSQDWMAKVRAQKSKPEITVMGVDDADPPTLVPEGLIVKLTPQDIPSLNDVYPQFIIADGHSVGIAVGWLAPHYNTERIKTPPTSYGDFWNPAYKGRVVIYSMKPSTSSIPFLVAASALATGKSLKDAQYDIDPGFAKIKELKPNLHSMTDQSLTILPLMVQGEVWMFTFPSRIAGPFVAKGAPIARAEPKEGPFLAMNVVTLVANSPMQDLGKDFINRLLSEKVQLEMTKRAFTGPVNRKVQVPADLRKLVPSGPDDVAKMLLLDWAHINKNKAAWIDRWNREITS